MAFTDELATGVVPVGAPELLGTFELTPARAAGWTLVAFGALAAFVEPPLLALAHGRRERPLRVAGLGAMAIATLGAALAPSYGWLLAALALYGPASGLGTNLSEAALVAANPGRAETALARWTLLGLLGDLAAPSALAASVALGFGWRGALVAVAMLAAAQAAHASRIPVRARQREEGRSIVDALRAAARRPALVGWSLAAATCGLMDELLLAFGALWLDEALGVDATRRALVLTAWVAGGIAGAALLERASRPLRPATLLAGSAVGCAAAYGGWLVAPSWTWSAVAFGAAGLFAAMHHPLLRARAFAAMPDRPHVVLATGSALGTIDLILPLLVGAIADRAGLLAAMLALFAQPAAVLAAAVAARRPG